MDEFDKKPHTDGMLNGLPKMLTLYTNQYYLWGIIIFQAPFSASTFSGVDISISYRHYRYALAYQNINTNFRYRDIFDISLITVITAQKVEKSVEYLISWTRTKEKRENVKKFSASDVIFSSFEWFTSFVHVHWRKVLHEILQGVHLVHSFSTSEWEMRGLRMRVDAWKNTS